MTTPRLTSYSERIIGGTSMMLTIDHDAGHHSIVVTDSTPGATDGLTGDPQPILVVWGGATEPLARIALRDGLVAVGWAPFVPAPAQAPVGGIEQYQAEGR
jgi:hypothetical protein